MHFREQTLGGFLDARDAASALLLEAGVKDRAIRIEEAILMQAAAVLLSENTRFHGLRLSKMTGIQIGTTYPALDRFENTYGMLASGHEQPDDPGRNKRTGAYRRYYQATEFGANVLALFTMTGA